MIPLKGTIRGHTSLRFGTGRANASSRRFSRRKSHSGSSTTMSSSSSPRAELPSSISSSYRRGRWQPLSTHMTTLMVLNYPAIFNDFIEVDMTYFENYLIVLQSHSVRFV
jgi:hypothetical protein